MSDLVSLRLPAARVRDPRGTGRAALSMLERLRKKGGHGGMGFAFQISEDSVPDGVIAQECPFGRPVSFSVSSRIFHRP